MFPFPLRWHSKVVGNARGDLVLESDIFVSTANLNFGVISRYYPRVWRGKLGLFSLFLKNMLRRLWRTSFLPLFIHLFSHMNLFVLFFFVIVLALRRLTHHYPVSARSTAIFLRAHLQPPTRSTTPWPPLGR